MPTSLSVSQSVPQLPGATKKKLGRLGDAIRGTRHLQEPLAQLPGALGVHGTAPAIWCFKIFQWDLMGFNGI